MKFAKALLIAVSALTLVAGTAFSATVLTDAQIAEIATVAQAGGDVTQAAEDMMAGITNSLIAQGLTGEELQAQVAVALQEMTSGLDAGAPGFEAVVSGIVQGATSGAVRGVNQAAGADPNLDTGALTSAVTNGAAGGVAAIGAANPGVNTGNLQAAVNQGAQSQGATPPEPEAFEPAGNTPGDTPPAETPAAPTPPPAPVTPPTPPTVADVPPVETPPTGDDIASN